MNAGVEVLEVARQEFDEAYVYYESAKIGLGVEFREGGSQEADIENQGAS